MHFFEVDDQNGDLLDLIPFCSDWCHRSWCVSGGGVYDGWNGAHEVEYSTVCAWCQEKIVGFGDLEEDQ